MIYEQASHVLLTLANEVGIMVNYGLYTLSGSQVSVITFHYLQTA